MLRFDGKHNPSRRAQVEQGTDEGYLIMPTDDGGTRDLSFGTFRKKVMTYAAQIDEPFEVDTLEGMHTGKAGDWLAVGPAGEMYPIDQQVFADSYEPVEEE